MGDRTAPSWQDAAADSIVLVLSLLQTPVLNSYSRNIWASAHSRYSLPVM